MTAWFRGCGLALALLSWESLAAGEVGADQSPPPSRPSFTDAQHAVQGLWECMLDWRKTVGEGKQREVLLPDKEDEPLDAWARYMQRRSKREAAPKDTMAGFDEYLAECAARAMIRAARADGIAEGCLSARGQTGAPGRPALPVP